MRRTRRSRDRVRECSDVERVVLASLVHPPAGQNSSLRRSLPIAAQTLSRASPRFFLSYSPCHFIWLGSLHPRRQNGHKSQVIERRRRHRCRGSSIPVSTLAPSRKRHAGWSPERQRIHRAPGAPRPCRRGLRRGRRRVELGLSVEAQARRGGLFRCMGRCASAGRHTRCARGSHVRTRAHAHVERFYRDGELVMERRIPSDFCSPLTTFGLTRCSSACPRPRRLPPRPRSVQRRAQTAARSRRLLPGRAAGRVRGRSRSTSSTTASGRPAAATYRAEGSDCAAIVSFCV